MLDTIANLYNDFLRLANGDTTAASNLVLVHTMQSVGTGQDRGVDPEKPMTVPEVAKLLRVRPDKVLAWIRSGRLRGYNVAEKETGRPKYRVNREDLEAFTQQRSVTQPAPKGRPAGRRLPQPKWKP